MSMDPNINQAAQAGSQMPVAKNEDVEFSAALADNDDLEARERAEEADARQQQE